VWGTHRSGLRAAAMDGRRCLMARFWLCASAATGAYSKGRPAARSSQMGAASFEDERGSNGSA
jgi:hypothetical protein